MKESHHDIYDPKYVGGLFDAMAKTYGVANVFSSFGFTSLWRKQCVRELPVDADLKVGYDLMSGMGESWHHIQNQLDPNVEIIGVDISEEMNKRAEGHIRRLNGKNISLLKTNILENNISSESADFIVSTFGIKTFDKNQQQILAKEVNRILKPGGFFSFIEISEPNSILLRVPFMFYIQFVIPLIGKIFLNDLESYKMLGEYCRDFKDSNFFNEALKIQGLNSKKTSYFFGCATGVTGRKSIT